MLLILSNWPVCHLLVLSFIFHWNSLSFFFFLVPFSFFLLDLRRILLKWSLWILSANCLRLRWVSSCHTNVRSLTELHYLLWCLAPKEQNLGPTIRYQRDRSLINFIVNVILTSRHWGASPMHSSLNLHLG